MTKAVTILPRLRSFAAPVMAPASTRSTTESVNISVWMPRSRFSRRKRAVAAGIAPIPSWSVAPSGIELGDECADPPLDVADLADRVLVRRDVDLDREVDVVDVDEAVAECPRHRAVELDDDGASGTDCGMDRLDRGSQRAEPVRVGRRGVDEHRVEREGARVEQVGHVRQEDRHVVRPPLIDRPPGVRSDEQRPVPDVAGHLRSQVRPRTLDVQMHDADVGQVLRLRPLDQRVEEDRRRRGGAVNIDLVTAADRRRGLLG